MARVFITGGTGYVGRRLARALLESGYEVRVLTRAESSSRVPAGGDTLVHLVGTPHPSPSKAAEFRRVDLPSILASAGLPIELRILRGDDERTVSVGGATDATGEA